MKFGLFTMPKSLLVSEPEIITKGVIAYQRALPPQSNSLPKRPNAQESLRTATAMLEVEMQQGSLIRSGRKRGPDVWQFRWGDKGPFGKRICRRRVIGMVCQYADVESARKSVAGLLTEINGNGLKQPISRDSPWDLFPLQPPYLSTSPPKRLVRFDISLSNVGEKHSVQIRLLRGVKPISTRVQLTASFSIPKGCISRSR